MDWVMGLLGCSHKSIVGLGPDCSDGRGEIGIKPYGWRGRQRMGIVGELSSSLLFYV
jgi:hypothetical protein